MRVNHGELKPDCDHDSFTVVRRSLAMYVVSGGVGVVIITIVIAFFAMWYCNLRS